MHHAQPLSRIAIPDTVHETLRADHARIDALLVTLLERADGPLDAVDRAFGELEQVLLAHMDAEEMYILPMLARQDPGRASEIAEDHATIRCVLAEIGLAFAVGVVRRMRLRELAIFLLRHAELEDADLYDFADEWLSRRAVVAVVGHLKPIRPVPAERASGVAVRASGAIRPPPPSAVAGPWHRGR
jgi:hypothetical protein